MEFSKGRGIIITVGVGFGVGGGTAESSAVQRAGEGVSCKTNK